MASETFFSIPSFAPAKVGQAARERAGKEFVRHEPDGRIIFRRTAPDEGGSGGDGVNAATHPFEEVSASPEEIRLPGKPGDVAIEVWTITDKVIVHTASGARVRREVGAWRVFVAADRNAATDICIYCGADNEGEGGRSARVGYDCYACGSS